MSVRVEVETPFSIGEYTFSNRSFTTLYVPSGCKKAYEEAEYWSDFKEIVEMGGSDVTMGDVNGDNTISPADAIEVLYMYFGAGGNTGSKNTRSARPIQADTKEAE